MVTAQNITTKQDIVKPLQYVTEGDRITSPALYGVTPSSATFIIVGNTVEINPQPDVAHLDVSVLGTEDLVNAVLTGRAYTFGFRWQPIDFDLMRYIWNSTGTVNGPDSSLSFTWSELINGVEHFSHVRGFTPTTLSLTLERGVWEAEMAGIAQDITVKNTTDGNAGTPVYLSSETTSAPVSHTDAGANPFTWNANVYGERRFTCTITRDAAIQAVNGENDIIYSKPSTRGIVFGVDAFLGTHSATPTELQADWEAKLARAASYKFSTSPAKTMSFVNSVLTSWSQVPAAGTTDAFIESITARAESVTNIT